MFALFTSDKINRIELVAMKLRNTIWLLSVRDFKWSYLTVDNLVESVDDVHSTSVEVAKNGWKT